MKRNEAFPGLKACVSQFMTWLQAQSLSNAILALWLFFPNWIQDK